MKRYLLKPICLSMLIVISIIATTAFVEDQTVEKPPQEYKLVVKVIDDEWRVVYPGDASKTDLTVRRKDRIRWTVTGSDASFQFPDAKIFGDGSRTVKDGNPLVLVVTKNAPKGIHTYSIFIHKDLTYARGQSPPRIIIE